MTQRWNSPKNQLHVIILVLVQNSLKVTVQCYATFKLDI